MLKRLLILSFLTVLFVFSVRAQKGTISGAVSDAKTFEELIGVTIAVEGTTKGAATDIFGNFQLSLEPGNYTIVASYVSYATQKIENVIVEDGKVTKLNISLSEEQLELEEIVISAEQINNNEVALLRLQSKSIAVQDGISAVQISRIGATNSAESVKAITGASVEEGKYVVFRGLGDRYSISQMNGVTLPSTDPYRNSSSLDLIASSMVENIITTKTFTPDQPGNFTGGNVNITSKSLPDQFYLNFGVSLTYNTQSSFRNILTDRTSSSLDWAGVDAGARRLPSYFDDEDIMESLKSPLYIEARQITGDPAVRSIFNKSYKSLDNSFIPTNTMAFLNQRYTMSFGNRKDFEQGKFGYNFGLNINKSYTRWTDRQVNIWEYQADPGATQLGENFNTTGERGSISTTMGGIFSMAYQHKQNNEYNFNFLFNHDGDLSAQELVGSWPGALSTAHTLQTRSIAYKQRLLGNFMLSGKHVFPGANNMKLEWNGGYTRYIQNEPDTRFFADWIENDMYFVNASELQFPFHFFRDLNDNQYNFKSDLTIPLKGTDELKFGGYYHNKIRNFNELRFQVEPRSASIDAPQYVGFTQADGDYDAFFNSDNGGIIGQAEDGSFYTGNSILNQTEEGNQYEGNEIIYAGYGMIIKNLSEKLKAIAGVRLEGTDFSIRAGDGSEGEIVRLDLLPSVNLIYKLSENSNLRLSGSQTVARPNLRELAPFISFELLGGFVYQGNPDLERTTIQNYDVRYEIFPKAAELIAISGFYKSFRNPIVTQLSPLGSGFKVLYQNVDEAHLYGTELEFRKNLEFISSTLSQFDFSTNLTLTYSEVSLTQEEIDRNQALNPELETVRPFKAQSPFIANANLSYTDIDNGFNATFYLNIWGRRIVDNSLAGAPDIYEQNGNGRMPSPTINITAEKRLNDKFVLGVKAMNLTNYLRVKNQEFLDNFFITESFRQGMNFSVSLKYNPENLR